MLIIGGSGSEKTNALLNLIKEQDNDNLIDKIYFYAKDLNEPRYQFLIKRCGNVGIKHLNAPQAIIEYSQYVDDVHNNIVDYNPNRNRKILIEFDDMIAAIMTNEKIQVMIKKLLNYIYIYIYTYIYIYLYIYVYIAFITQSYFSVLKKVRLNYTYYLIMKTHNKRKLQNIATNHSAGIDYKDFMSTYIKCTNVIFFLTTDTTLPDNNPLKFDW